MMLDLSARMPLIALRDSIVFPSSSTPLLVGREVSVRAADIARERNDGFLLLVLQKDLDQEEITSGEQFRSVGLVARLQNVTYLPNGFAKILVEGILPARLHSIELRDGAWTSHLDALNFSLPADADATTMRHHLLEMFKRYAEGVREVPQELLVNLTSLAHPVDVAYGIMPFMQGSLEERQKLLECESLQALVDRLLAMMAGSLEMKSVHARIEQDVRHRMQQNQREWFIQEQIRVLQDELENPELQNPDMARLDKRIREKKFPPLIEEKVREEFARLPQMHPSTPEYSVVRNYLDWMLALPFGEYTQDRLELAAVRAALDAEHYGLEKVKERILEHAAVLKLAEKVPSSELRTPILCLVGPPGVGKTTLARSIAEAMGRNFIRITLGGVRDEAEIRGHRRTYIGSMPGRIVQALRKAKSMNPLILLDEIDKMSSDFRGDPASALLEVLDPEQNREFQDHYLEAGIDLSRVLFFATANTEERIPTPLQDRMEVVRLSGYLRHEKHEIVQRHLLRKVRDRNGLTTKQIKVGEGVLDGILDGYTRESGVRELERQLDRLCRKRALEIVSEQKFKSEIVVKELPKYLGVAPFHQHRLQRKVGPGVITGLAYTSVGGEVLQIECTLLSGRGRLQLTGTLGDVMKESAQIALTLVRQRTLRYGVDPEIYRKTDIHIHIPEGAVPKDGPSAGIALTLALFSAFTRQAVAPTIGFTGEVSLTGQIHAIGGLTEKSMAALQAGATTLHLPSDNQRQIDELPKQVKEGLAIFTHNHIDELISVLFPAPEKKKAVRKK